jgi:hypothetical protein
MADSWLLDPLFLGVVGVAVAALGGATVYYGLRKKESPEELERRRREHLNTVGRIIDGTVLDMRDVELHGQTARHVFYQYEIAGVTYECSQDVSVLAAQIEGATSTPGMPTSVRYDQRNPTNSMVVSEGWTGLHLAHNAAHNSLRFVRAQGVDTETASHGAGHASG